MVHEPRETSAWLVDFAASRFDIARDDLQRLVRAAEQAGEPPLPYLSSRGLLDSVQVDILTTLLRPRETLDDFEFLDLLGRGSMGVVYRARQLSLDRNVAIKTIVVGATAAANRFAAEARTIAKLRHPHVVTAYELIHQSHRWYLVLELLEGDTLEQRLQPGRRLSEFMTWQLIRQAASGLVYAAEQNVVHRDVKPGNLFLMKAPAGFTLPSGIPLLKLTDFGLAGLIHRQEGATELTADGKILGTPAYMAPEQLSSSHVDQRADLYALGATAFQMLHGGPPPFAGQSLATLLMRKVAQPPPRLDALHDDVSTESADLVESLLQIDPDQRVNDYQLLIDRIDQNCGRRVTSTNSLTETTSVADVSVAMPHVRAVSTRRLPRPLIVAAGLILVVISLLGIWYVAWSSPRIYATRMESTGQGEALFDGESLKGWYTVGGALFTTLDGEKSSVLEFSQGVSRSLPSYPSFEFSVGVNLRDARLFEASFDDAQQNPCIMVRLTRSAVSVLTPIAVGAPAKIVAEQSLDDDPWRGGTPDAPIYRELRLTREPGRWVIAFDGNIVAELPPTRERSLSRVRFRSDAACHLEGVALRELRPVAETAPPS